jgi:lysophospholipase L1-like esterase
MALITDLSTLITTARCLVCSTGPAGVPPAPFVPTVFSLIFDGDSLTQGFDSSPGFDYPAQAAGLIRASGNNVLFELNEGVGGSTVPAMASRIPNWSSNITPSTIVVLWGGVNDFNTGDSASKVYNAIVSYCSLVQAAGANRIILTTVDPYAHNTTIEAKRITLNAMLRSNWQTIPGVVGLSDPGGDSRIGNFDSVLNTLYYQPDEIHMTDLGYGIIAQLATNVILSLPKYP